MDDLDRILGSERGVTPSPTFTDRVMSAVRSEAAGPAPIAFPWRRVAPVLVLWGVALAAAIVLFAIVLARSNAPMDAQGLAAKLRAIGAVGSTGLPLAVGALLGSWLLFRRSLRS
jgi:hypothetical protein